MGKEEATVEDDRLAYGLCGGQLAVGTIALAAIGGPLWAVVLCGSLAGWGILHAVKGDG